MWPNSHALIYTLPYIIYLIMQRHKFSYSACTPFVVFLLGVAYYIYAVNAPSYLLITVAFFAALALWHLIDIRRNISYRDLRRQDMDITLSTLTNFHADETYHTQYNGFTLQIDKNRGKLAFIDHNLDIQCVYVEDITSCFYLTDYYDSPIHQNSHRDTYSQIALCIRTNNPNKERLVFPCFDQWYSYDDIVRRAFGHNKGFLQAMKEVQDVVERINRMTKQ